ncbi:glutamate receptor ionotropic, kainate 3-like isoform X2 [Physella acuta]|uniref:glutamate receptor ionotropic, kainate 3-like isoform X2 n=1 Tax=Physella acuta TaxID=109671 RepID=UPI0027DCE330|nr:glutamate receptor ionotropic, kainate 3-like isoform X2 [Physella acuta]
MMRDTTKSNPKSEGNCKLLFNPLNLNKTNGEAFYDSLVKARDNFDSSNVAVAIGPFIEVFSSTSYVITKQVHMLTSAAGQNAGMMDPKRVVSILPEPSSLSTGIAKTVIRIGWKNVAFLAQDDFSPVLSLGQNNVTVWPIRLPNKVRSPDDPELVRNLIELRKSEKERFILHSNKRDVVMNVLIAAQQLHLLHHSIEWFVTYPDFYDLIRENETWPGTLFGLQLLVSSKIPPNISEVVKANNMTLSRLELGLAVDVVGILKHVIMNEYKNCVTPVVTENKFVSNEIFQWQLENQTMRYHGALGEYAWHKETKVRTGFNIDIIMYHNGKPTRAGNITFHNNDCTVNYFKSRVNRTRAKEHFLFGKDEILRVATKEQDPFVIKRGDGYIGFSIDLLDLLKKKVNFSYELFEAEDVKTNGSSPLGENGMVYALQTGNASMAIGALEVSAERENTISFSYTILSSQASILIKKADSTTNFFQFLGPFSAWLWLMILVFIMVAGVSLYVMSRFDPTQEGNIQRFDLKESLWYSINIVLQGSTDYSPQTTSMRAIIAFFWFCVLIIEAAYTANLAAHLTLQQIDNRIKTVHDLASQTLLRYGVEKGTELHKFFQLQKEDPYQRMWTFMKLHEADVVLENTTEIIDQVKAGKLAFIADGVTNGYYANQHCGIESIEQNFGSKDFSLGFPKGAPYLDDINRALLQLKEEGALDTLKEKWWSTGRNCTEKDKSRSISQKTTPELELTNMIGVFIVLAVFIILAVVVDVGSRFYKFEKSKREEKTMGGSTKSVELYDSTETNVLDNNFIN